MVLDTGITQKVWGGIVVARFVLSPSETVVSTPAPPTYLVLQRNSYLPLYQEKIQSHFAPFLQEEDDKEIWFDVDGKPLKWHYPIGVLIDTLFTEKTTNVVDINVHFHDFPECSLLHLKNIDAMESCFMSTLKEADNLKHRGQVINNMNRSQHKQLWNSLRAGDYEKFWSINGKLMDGYEKSKTFRLIPLRVYLNEEVRQELVSPINREGGMLTLGDIMPKFFKSEENPTFTTISHGIHLPLNVPLQWLSVHMSYADNFLHVAVSKI